MLNSWKSYYYAFSTEDTFFQDFLVILASELLENFEEMYFFVTDSSCVDCE